ncbi:malonyl-CoA-acyl carrier protein transacylase, mitochondrial-like [Rhinoraja longicauda]
MWAMRGWRWRPRAASRSPGPSGPEGPSASGPEGANGGGPERPNASGSGPVGPSVSGPEGANGGGPERPNASGSGPVGPSVSTSGPERPNASGSGPVGPSVSTSGPEPPLRRPALLLFPGQGSQAVGMVTAGALLVHPRARDMFTAARHLLGYDLLDLCERGPPQRLLLTRHCQPAVFVTSLAAAEALNHRHPRVIEQCVGAAGFSVGEFAALVFAGAMDFTEALYVVKVRAEAMQEASDSTPSGMLSVVGRAETCYSHVCLEAREHCKSLGIEEPVCEVANYLFPNGRVIAGHLQALEFLQQHCRRFHLVRTKLLPVSGAFHTRLMASAAPALHRALQGISVEKPLIPVYSNVDGKRYMNGPHIRRQLVKQLVSPVKWEQTMHTMYGRVKGTDFPDTFEVGPGNQLGTMLKQCNLKAGRHYRHLDTELGDQSEED